MIKLTKSTMGFIAIFSIALLFSLVSALAIPGTWKGYVTVDSSNASSGTFVAGFVAGDQLQNKTTGDPSTVPDNYYILDLIGSQGQSVTFKVYGVAVNESAQTWSEGIHQLNLTMTPSASGGSCTYGPSWANSGCASSLTCCSDNTCKSSCSSSSSSSSSSGGSGGGGSSSGGGGGVSACLQQWTCTDWSACLDGIQVRSCSDKKKCGTTDLKPKVSRSCGVGKDVAEESAAQPPSTSGSKVGEVQSSDGVNWKWSGNSWAQEGTSEYEQIQEESSNLITGAAAAVVDVVKLNISLFIGMLLAIFALIILLMILRKKKEAQRKF